MKAIKTWLFVKILKAVLMFAYKHLDEWFAPDNEDNPEAVKSKIRQYVDRDDRKSRFRKRSRRW